MRVPILLDRALPVPLHRQIYDEWRRGILTGRFRRSERVPSSRELATALEVSRTTVTAAYEQLIAEGYLDTARGSGTFVCRELPDQPLRQSALGIDRRVESPALRLSRYGTRLGAGVMRTAAPTGVIDLSKAGPDGDHFPLRLWRRLMMRHLRHVTPVLFDYAEHAAGDERLRGEIAAYLGRSRAIDCTPDQVIVVNGSQQALDLCVRLLVDEGDEVAVEEPGYPGIRQLVVAHGARLRPIPVGADGLSARDLPDGVRFVCVTPSHQLPTGVSMSLARRLALIAWARACGAVLIEDDYDSAFRYSGPPLPAMQSLSTNVAVIYTGTFSNVMFPGLRIGYLVVPRGLVAPFTRAKWLSDRHTRRLEQSTLADFLSEGHFDRHVRRMRRLYEQRRDTLLEALARHFGADATITGDAAGMHVVVRFASPGIAARARRNGVWLRDLGAYYLSDAPANAFIICFSAIGERTIREGVKRLAARVPSQRAGTRSPVRARDT